jgi:hypothetical protein
LNTELLITRFNENIAYIEVEHPRVFSKLVALDNAVQNGYYQEKYELVFENEYFDVLEKSTNRYLYQKSSADYANLASQSIDYEVNDNLFICSAEHKITSEELEYYNKLPLFKNYLSSMAPILHYMQQKTDIDDSLNELNKFIFFGVGLGGHIETIHNKIKAKQYLIIEDDLELFRLSLFTINYNSLAQESELFFSVFDDTDEFALVGEEFLKKHYEENYYIKFFQMLSHSEDKRQEFHLVVTTQAHLRFSYSNMLTQNLLPLNYLSDSYKFLKKSITLKNTTFEDKPFLLLGAGPSLQKNVEILKKRSKDFVIVAVSAILPFLEKESIVPNIIVHLDAFEAATRHFDRLISLEFIKDSICLFSAKTDPLITLRLPKENIYFYEDSTSYKIDSFRPSSSCVGSIAYQILLYLKVKKIYLLGLDLAVDRQTKNTHSDFHTYVKTLNDKVIDESNIEYKNHLISVPGNRGDTVLSTPHFKTSIETINYSTSMIKTEFQSVKNFGEGAAFSEVEFCDFSLFEGKEISNGVQEELKRVFSNHVSEGLLSKELQSLEKKLEFSQYVRETLQKYRDIRVKSIKEFKCKLLKLVEDISSDVNNDLCRIFETYFRYLLPYIFNFLNKKSVTITESDFDAINKMIVQHLLDVS